MAFDLTRLNRYLPESATMDYIANGVVNSYAPVGDISNNSITIINSMKIDGDHVQFTAGTEIFIHVSASRNGTDKAFLGLWTFAEITNVSGNVLTIDRDITGTIPAGILTNYHVQAITVPFFNSMTGGKAIQNDVSPPAFDTTKMCGGILVLKAVTLVMGGPSMIDSRINLHNKGIPVDYANKDKLRPWFNYELNGMKDTDSYAGWENAMLEHRLPLNVGDGAALIYGTTGGAFGYIRTVGNHNKLGVRYCRGAVDSINGGDFTNIGGSTILMIAKGRTAAMDYASWACKYRSTSDTLGRGLGACMFVTATKTAVNFNDGGLYAHMTQHKLFPSNLKLANMFGNGSIAKCSGADAQKQMNNYALITTTSTNATYNVKKVAYTKKTTAGVAPIQAGALVLITIFNKNTWQTLESILCNVIADNGTYLTLDKSINLGANRQAFVTSIPQFKNFTLSALNSATPEYSNGIGGIFAIAVSGTCNLSGGRISVSGKGGVPINITNPSLVENHNILTLGSGNGSVLILANKLTMNTSTQIGMATSTLNHGNKLGGRGGNGTVSGNTVNATEGAMGGGYRGVNNGNNVGGHGGAGGTGSHKGGYFSSGTFDSYIDNKKSFGIQGAHVMIIAETITNFNIHAISTGGMGWVEYQHGGAGYGGGGGGQGSGGGFRGGGAGNFASGGSAGYAFIWCNNATNQVLDGTILDE